MSDEIMNDDQSPFTGYAIELENREEIANTATPFTITYGDYQAPDEIDPRKMVRHDDQGNMGSCGGHANSNCGEYLWLIAEGDKQFSDAKQFSRLYAYLEAQRIDRLLGRDAGSTISGGLKVAYAGYLEEKFLRYSTPYPANARSVVTEEMRDKATAFKVRSHAWLKSYDAIFNYLASGQGSIFVGTVWNNSFYASNGVLESVSLRNGGGHAYAFLGYSKRKDSVGRNYLWRKNSHSNDNWTEVSPRVIDQLAGHNFTAIVGMSDLETPKPRPVDFTKQSVLG
jgi:hypothetical protein